MVDLPQVANGVPSVHAPQSRVSAGQIASPYLELANTLEAGARETGDVAKLLAHEEGLKAVTRDENGDVRVERPVIVGDAALSYKRAMQTAAVVQGDNAAKDGLLELRHKYRDDPASYAKAADAFVRKTQLQYEKAAGPDVGLAVGRVAANTSREMHEGLLNEKERRDLARATATIEAQIDTTRNELFALSAGGADMKSPEVRTRLEKIGALWGQLANNPRIGIPKERVEYELSQLRSELDVAGMDRRVAQIQAQEGTQAAMAAAERIKTDPSLNLTPGQRTAYYSRVVGGINQRINAQTAIDKGTMGEIQAIVRAAENGNTVPPEQMAQARSAVIQSGNPALVAALQHVETVQPIIADWRKSSPAQLERSLADLDRTMREQGETPGMRALYETGTKLLKNMRDGIKADPLGWANRTGAVQVPDIDWSAQGDVLATQMRARAAAGDTVSQLYGTVPRYLRPDEKAALTQVAGQGGAPMVGLATALVQGFGDRAPRVLSEIGKDAPVLAHVGGLVAANGSPAVVRDAAEAVALRRNPDFKLPHWLNKPSDKIMAAQHQSALDTYGGAFALAGESGRAAEATANDAYFARANRQGLDPLLADKNSATAHHRALQESAGAVFSPDGVQYGGIGDYRAGILPWGGKKVLVPGNVRADSFRDVVGALKDDDLGGQWQAFGRTYGVKDVQAAVPVATRGGYRFAIGDPLSDDPKWIPDANGKPLTIDFDKLEPALRQRVPQAYSGG